MPFNGAGTFTSLGVPTFPAVPGTYILASYFNATMNDVFLGLSTALPRDGQAAMTANLPMGGFKVTGLRAGVNPTDGVNFAQVFTTPTFDNATFTGVTTIAAGALISGYALLASPTFTGVPAAPTATVGDNSTQLATTAFVQNTAFSTALPNQTGNVGKFVTTNGTVASWAALGGLVPIGGLVAFDSMATANTITDGAGATYLKTGVIADATTYPNAAAAPYISAVTKSIQSNVFASVCAPASYNSNGYGCQTATDGTTVVYLGASTEASGNSGGITTDGLNWTPIRIPALATTETHYAVTYGGGLFCCMVANRAYCYTSPDGITWTQRTMPATSAWCGVIYGNGRFVAVGTTTTTAYSTNGTTWVAGGVNGHSISSTTAPCRILYGASLFVCANNGGANISTSPDGTTWTNRTVAAFTGGTLSMAFGNGTFVLKAADTTNGVRTSTDGITWTVRAVLGGNNNNMIYFANGNFHVQFLTPATNYYSSNGITWNTLANALWNTYAFEGVFTAGGMYFAMQDASAGTLNSSFDGTSWGRAGLNASYAQLAYGNAWYFGVNTNTGSTAAEHIWSKDGLSWTSVLGTGMGAVTTAMSGAAYFNSLYIVMGASQYWTSPDRINWTSRTPPSYTGYLFAANTKLFALSAASTNAFAFSTDGLTWTNITGTVGTGIWRGVVFGNSKYMTWTDSLTTPYISTDGVTWTIGASIGDTPRFIFFQGGLFVAVCSSGTVYTSTDGSAWTLRTAAYRQSAGASNTWAGYAGTTLIAGGTTTSNLVSSDPTVLVANRGYVAGTNVLAYGLNCQVSNGGVVSVVGSGGSSAQFSLTAANKVLNDVNLKTYNATTSEQTNFYKRVA